MFASGRLGQAGGQEGDGEMGKLDDEGQEEDKRKDRKQKVQASDNRLAEAIGTDSSKVFKYDDNNHESAPLDQYTLLTLVIPQGHQIKL